MRDHGDSDDEDLRFAGERRSTSDVLGVGLAHGAGRAEGRIGILGMSFRAATTVIAGGEERGVQAVWEDSSFADMDEAIRDFLATRAIRRSWRPAAARGEDRGVATT
jgi:hypothetical protein